MSNRIGVLVIHGMGAQRPGFSEALTDEISHRLSGRASRLVWQEVHWADALEPRETELWDCMQDAHDPGDKPVPLDWRPVREFIVHNFGDAIAYQRDWTHVTSAYNTIHDIVSTRLRALKQTLTDPSAPIVIIAHSLGAHIMSNYIWDRQHPSGDTPDRFEAIDTLVAMITFGSNIPLFSLAFPTALPIDLPGTGVEHPAIRAAAKWLNFLDRDDVLGWPLRPLYEKNIGELTADQISTVARIEDHEIRVGSIFTTWNPFAHQSYWTDNDFTRPVASYLGALISTLDG